MKNIVNEDKEIKYYSLTLMGGAEITIVGTPPIEVETKSTKIKACGKAIVLKENIAIDTGGTYGEGMFLITTGGSGEISGSSTTTKDINLNLPVMLEDDNTTINVVCTNTQSGVAGLADIIKVEIASAGQSKVLAE